MLRGLAGWSLVAAVAAATGCADENLPDVPPLSEGPNVGIGWAIVFEPTEEPTFQTSAASIRVSGHAFVAPGAFCDALEGDPGAGYEVTWENRSTGASGRADVHLNCFLQVFLWWEIPEYRLSLSPGENHLAVTALDAAGNVGRDSIRISRQ
jgi:hypothetical protein